MAETTNTIAAIATPPGVGGVAIIRVSGAQALAIAQKITSITTFTPNMIIPAQLRSTQGEALDRGMLAYFKAPRSYTGEDTIELHCHGSWFLAQTILEQVILAGARLAEPGEFTKRAFLSGKIDLTQAEAVADMIAAKSKTQAQLALKHLEGDVAKELRAIRYRFIELLSAIEANLDYPEEIDPPAQALLQETCMMAQDCVERLLLDSAKGMQVKQGLTIALAGRTNAGKSSLFNALVKEARAIVTEIHGTTRDYLEAPITLNGVAITLVDTAGIRVAEDKVESAGIERSQELMQVADMVLYVIDAMLGETIEDTTLIQGLQDKPHIVIWNKVDIPRELPQGVLGVSTLTKIGLLELEKAIVRKMDIESLDFSNRVYISSLRQKQKLFNVQELLNKCSAIPLNQYELYAIELKEIIYQLSEITGDAVSDEIISYIFDHFCVGK